MAEMQTNQNDYKVVTFQNGTDFEFSPEMGAMYDGRPIFGISGGAIQPGESIQLPYHVGNLLAKNLAKAVLNKRAPLKDPDGIPTGVPLWNDDSLEAIRASFVTDLYTEAKAAPLSQTDILMAKVEELRKMVEGKKEEVADVAVEPTTEAPQVLTYQDKAEVIAEITKRGIKFDARSSKATLETLLS
jgi:hypothetical protein